MDFADAIRTQIEAGYTHGVDGEGYRGKSLRRWLRSLPPHVPGDYTIDGDTIYRQRDDVREVDTVCWKA